MGRRKQKLYLAIDDGSSSFKCLGLIGDELVPLIISPAVIEQRGETLDRYRQQVSSDLINRAFVGVNSDYFAVGNLAAKLGATQPLKPLKSETIVYKILAMVSMMAQRFNLGTSFDLHLGCLLPPGEFRDRQRIQADLLTALADFDTPVGVFSVKLVDCNFYAEGTGIARLLQINDRQSLGTAVILMAGHRNLSFYATESHEITAIGTCDLGFNHWVKAVRAVTYSYDLPKLSTAMANYWLTQDIQQLEPILRNSVAELRLSESNALVREIQLAHDNYCNSIFDWLDDQLPDRIDELMLAGGVGDVLQKELMEYFVGKLTPNPKYPDKYAIFNSSVFKLPVLDVPDGYQSRMADVYCMWKYLMPQPKIVIKNSQK
ncbi:MAG: hypothetical protein RLZZ135_1870 [Cyanobacteriota bacterium]|jgi:hypothetical protein